MRVSARVQTCGIQSVLSAYPPLPKLRLSQLQRAEQQEDVEARIMALNGLAAAQSRISLCQQYETLIKSKALVESSMRDGRHSNMTPVFKHTFYRYGLACSSMLQISHYSLYSASKKAGLHVTENTGDRQPSALGLWSLGGKKDEVTHSHLPCRRNAACPPQLTGLILFPSV